MIRPREEMKGTCKLCQAPESELRNSHVIPEFNYAPCYDGKHRFSRLSSTGPKHRKFEQKGYREHLLCQKCETKFSVWEGYAKRILTDGGLRLVHKDQRGYVLGGADYNRFKLYGMSLIWRMGVSSLSMFQEVRLGPHEFRLREALLKEDPLEVSEYPFCLTAVTIGGRFHVDVIVPPSLAKVDGQHIYRCVINGIVYSFVVGGHPADPGLVDMAVSEEGNLKIGVLPIEQVPFLHDHVVEIVRAVRLADSDAAQ